jgi:isoquinoline 1-oxidoreductase beta subunit
LGLGPHADLSSQGLLDSFRKLAATPGTSASQAGDPQGTFNKAAKKIDVEYSVPYLAHAPMEPLNCTVKISADKCEIWTGTQFQTLDQMVAGKITGLKPEQVEIHTEFLGGGFGRRANPTSDFVAEAVQVAKAAGMPVKTVWSREDDIRGGYYRSMFLHQARIGLDGQGMPLSWQHVLVGQSIMAGTMLEQTMVKNGIDEPRSKAWPTARISRAWPINRLSCIRRRPGSRCCGCVRWGTATPRLSWSR